MRLYRLCTLRKKGKCHVDEQTRLEYEQSGERREWLEIALLEAIKAHGTGRDAYNKVKAIGWFGMLLGVFLNFKSCMFGWDHVDAWVYVYFWHLSTHRRNSRRRSLWCGSECSQRNKRSMESGWQRNDWKVVNFTACNMVTNIIPRSSIIVTKIDLSI